MLKSLRDSLYTTVVAMTPFLLAACGEDPNNKPVQKMEIVLLTGLIFVASYAFQRYKGQRPQSARI